MKSLLTFSEDGTCHALKSDIVPLESLGGISKIKRVSHVLPANPAKRMAFLILRFAFGERGAVAEWARQWRGPWQVRWACSPHIAAFTHQSRRVCIDWEIDQIIEANTSDMERTIRN